MRMRFCVVAMCVALAGATVIAAENDPGRALYLRYCGACHGPGAKGDGIAATFLRPKPRDLTLYARGNGGAFPFQRIAQAIDGTLLPGAHGDRDMPVWGEVLATEDPHKTGVETRVRGKVFQITEYLRTLQEK